MVKQTIWKRIIWTTTSRASTKSPKPKPKPKPEPRPAAPAAASRGTARARPPTSRPRARWWKRLIPIPQGDKRRAALYGENLSFYRAAFFRQGRQTQYDLYAAGMAPKLTRSEARRLRAWASAASTSASNPGVRRRGARHRYYRPVRTMYAAQRAPNGFKAPPADPVARARARRTRAGRDQPARRRPLRGGGGSGSGGGGRFSDGPDDDALPAHPTPNSYVRYRRARPGHQGQRPPPPRRRPAAGGAAAGRAPRQGQQQGQQQQQKQQHLAVPGGGGLRMQQAPPASLGIGAPRQSQSKHRLQGMSAQAPARREQQERG